VHRDAFKDKGCSKNFVMIEKDELFSADSFQLRQSSKTMIANEESRVEVIDIRL
jgi:hypothetical protein